MTQVHDSAWRNISCWVQNKSNSEIAGQLTIWVVYQLKLCLKTIFVCKIDGENASVRGRRENCVENKLTEKHREILHYFWNKSFPDFGHFRIRKSDRKTVPSSSVIKVWQRERIQDTFDTSGRANLERKSAWELFSWRWSSSKILDHGGRGCRSRLTICQLIQFYTNSEAALLSRQTPLYVTFFVRTFYWSEGFLILQHINSFMPFCLIFWLLRQLLTFFSPHFSYPPHSCQIEVEIKLDFILSLKMWSSQCLYIRGTVKENFFT